MKERMPPADPRNKPAPLPVYTPAPAAGLLPPSEAQPFVVGHHDTPAGKVPRVVSALTLADRVGSWLARCNIRRMSFVVEPGLYALGRPHSGSPVLVSANYKMSFDQLRHALAGRDCWLLVLDTRGINVWCAAGKGTFSTLELYDRLTHSRLAEVVEHRRLIVPQLGAPGIDGLAVKKHSGFAVIWGPIQARDLPAFLDNNLVATPAMRRKDFPLGERLALIPVEVSQATIKAVLLISIFMLLSGLGGEGAFWPAVMEMGGFAAWAVAVAVISGTVLTPVLLPWLPGRAFSLKGLWAGLFSFLVLVATHGFLAPPHIISGPEAVAWLLMSSAISSWLGMNFTGSSTYTSRSGVRYEMRRAIPLQAGAFVAGMLCWLAARFWL